jgi:predicted metal-dependent HD superfamily phosphohydrolase
VQSQTPDYSKAEDFILNLLEEKLSPSLLYHCVGHTKDVLQAAMKIADTENISEKERHLLRIAALFHDAGFIYQYKDHEAKGCEMVNRYLPDFHFSETDISTVCQMIGATRVPQIPHSKLDQILADADLDYLGREDVVPIAQNLYVELKNYEMIADEKQWTEGQVRFLLQHHYFTAYSRKLREPNKMIYLNSLTEKEDHS